MMEIRSKARRLKSREPNLGLIVVDYLQLMTSGASAENRVQEVSQISRSLKVLARDLDVPILAISQLSRAVEQRHDKRPILSDLRESGSIEQDADLVMFIYRDEYYNGEESDQQGLAEVHLAKHRNGPTDIGQALVPAALREVRRPGARVMERACDASTSGHLARRRRDRLRRRRARPAATDARAGATARRRATVVEGTLARRGRRRLHRPAGAGHRIRVRRIAGCASRRAAEPAARRAGTPPA